MAATPTSEANEGPVLSFINKRLRALRKKQNRIAQMEEAIAQGKTLNKEQEGVLKSKPSVSASIDELEKLRQPLTALVAEEISLALEHHSQQVPASTTTTADSDTKDDGGDSAETESEMTKEDVVVEDLLNLLYFGTMFDVKNQNDFTSTMLTRTHERGCCLTYDYVTDDEATSDFLGEADLDSISTLGSLLLSRPVDSRVSHKNALQNCVEHAKQWLSHSDQLIDPDSNITYAGLRAKLNKIMASDYFTTSPEMKATVEMAAAAAGNYASFHMPGSLAPVSQVQVESSQEQYNQKEVEDSENSQTNGGYDNLSSPEAEHHKVVSAPSSDEFISQSPREIPSQTEEQGEEVHLEDQNQRDVESKEHQHASRRNNQNQRGGRGGGGRRGFPNGRGGRGSSRGGGPYQNGRGGQYYEQPGNFYPRSYHNNRGRGGRGSGGGGSGNFYNNHSSGGGGQAAYAAAAES